MSLIGRSTNCARDVNKCMCLHIEEGNYSAVLDCLLEGLISSTSHSCGRTAISEAAMHGQVEILKLLIHSCLEPDSDIFKKYPSSSTEIEVDYTPEDMKNLQWDKWDKPNDEDMATEDATEEQNSLYLYYAKTFERTGPIINGVEDLSQNCGSKRRPRKDPHTVDNVSMTPLHYAARAGHLDCVKILADNEANLDAVNYDGYTALHMCVEHIEVVKFLLLRDASSYLKTIDKGETPLHIAIRNKCSATANLLMKDRDNLNLTDDMEQTPLMCAIICDLDDIANALIKRDAGINFQDNAGYTALYYAVKMENYAIAVHLLELGARRVPTHYLLHYCVARNQRQMVELLMKYGDSLTVRNSDGETPILVAIQNHQAEMLEYLLKMARLCPFVEQVGQNELVLAMQSARNAVEFVPVARILFAYSEDASWMTSRMYPMSPSHSILYMCYTPYCHNALSRAIMAHKLDIAEFLIKEGYDISNICRDHVLGSIRTMVGSGFYELATLLVHVGFSYPYEKGACPTEWPQKRINFENDMRQLCSSPLSLQSLTRRAIRRRLGTVLNNSKAANIKYHATKQESGLSLMIKQLEIPKSLMTFLIDFDDCPTVMNPKYKEPLNVEEMEYIYAQNRVHFYDDDGFLN